MKMWIKHAVFTNFGRHRRLELNLCKGLLGVTGKNGSGKTTIVNGFHAALTNTWTRFAGTKDDNIATFAGAGEESSIRLDIEHDGVEFELYRALRAPRGVPAHCLTVGNLRLTKAPDIQAELERRLGVNNTMLSDYVFIDQGDITAFLKQTRNERAAAYQMLCGTSVTEAIHKAITVMLERDSSLFAGVVETGDEIRQKIATITEMLNVAENEKAAVTVPSPEKLAAAKQAVRQYEDAEIAIGSCASLEIAIANRSTELKECRVAVAEWDKLATDGRQLLAELQKQSDTANRLLGQLEQHRQSAAKRDAWTKNLEKALAVKSARQAPSLHIQDAELAGLQKKQISTALEIDRNQEILDTFDSSGLVECPTCGTPVDELEEHMRGIREKMPALHQQNKTLLATIDDIKRDRRRVEEHAIWLRVQDKVIADLKSQLAALSDTQPPACDSEELRQTIADCQEQQKRCDQAAASLNKARRQLADLDAADKYDNQRLTQSKAVFAACKITKAKYEAALHLIELADTARLTLAAVNERISQLQRSLVDDKNDLATLEVRLARSRRAIDLGERLRLLRDEVFHRTRLSQHVAQTNLKGMEADIAKVLHDFGDPFTVRAGDDLTFTVRFPSEQPLPDVRLSGGEQAVLAVAFRTAVSNRFAGDLNFMALDEPTGSLDENNLNFLSSAVSRYAAEIRGRRQVIMITHARSLVPAFDQVIEL